MFETTTISASDQLGRWGRIIGVSAIILGMWFTPTAQADVNTDDIRNFLLHDVVPPLEFITFAQDVAVKQVLQLLVRKPDGSFDAPFAKRLGFDKPVLDAEVDVQHARASSSPIAVFRIGLKRLQQFTPGDSPLKLIAADANWLINLPDPLPQGPFPARFFFPITVQDSSTAGSEVVKSSVRLQASYPSSLTPPKLDFDIERFGSSTLIRRIDKWRRNPIPPGAIIKEYFLVWVPALDRYYLGRLHSTTHELLIKAITADPQINLNEGKEGDASRVFEKLKAEALTIDADDPDAPPR
jgi:hypothetical protein